MDSKITIAHAYGLDESVFDQFKIHNYEVEIDKIGPKASIDPELLKIIDLVFANLPVEFIRDLIKDAGKEGLEYVVNFFFKIWVTINLTSSKYSKVSDEAKDIDTRMQVIIRLDDDRKGFRLYGKMTDDVAKDAIRQCLKVITEKKINRPRDEKSGETGNL